MWRGECSPLHPLGAFFVAWGNASQLLPQHADFLDGIAHVRGQIGGNPPPDNVCHLGTVSIGADHDLQRAVSMHAAKVKVAFGRDVGNVGSDPLLLAQLPYLRRSFGIINGSQDHGDVRVVEVRGLEFAVVVLDLILLYPVCDLIVETISGADEDDFCIRIQQIQDAAGSHLDLELTSTQHRRQQRVACGMRETDFSATNDKNAFVTNLPSEDERSTAFNFGEVGHGGCVCKKRRGIEGEGTVIVIVIVVVEGSCGWWFSSN